MNEREEVFDWLKADEFDTSQRRGAVASRTGDAVGVNPVNGHGRACECPQCPGWYERRVRPVTEATVPPSRRPNVLVDQVIPVCVLMAMVTVCGLVLLPVIVPLVAMSAVLVIALAVVVAAGSAAVVYAVNAAKSASRANVVRGEVVRGRWR